MKYQFIGEHQTEFAIRVMCRVLQVSASGYYGWVDRPVSERQQEDEKLTEQIRAFHQRSRQTYGSPRIHADLRDMGFKVSRKRVARLMRLNGIRARQQRRYKTTTKRDPARLAAPNLLAQDFSANQVNEKWLADITYIDTHEGWLYLAAVLDAHSRKIVGWSMSPRLHRKLVEDALKMGLGRRTIMGPLIHHSDQGSQYTSEDYQNLLIENHIQVSMSGTGNCYDNAMMESFFGTLKTECVIERYATRQQARQEIFEYIEVWYNRQRRHSSLGYLSPEQFEQLAA
jgi:transposase InsO family protein